MGFVAEYESANWFTADAAAATVTCAVGDVLVAGAVCGNQLRTLGISGGGLTWTARGVVSAASRCSITQWTAVVGPGQGGTFAVTATFSGGGAGGVGVRRYDQIASIGAAAVGDATGPAAPALIITNTAADSIVDVIVGDHSTVDGAIRAWRTADAGALTETSYWRINFENAAYAGHHPAAGAAGAKTVGLTTPAMRYSIAAVELIPVADLVEPAAAGGFGVPIRPISDAAVSWAQRVARFETVNGGELTHMPGHGLRAAVWVDLGDGIKSSGLDALSMRMDVLVRVYGPVHSQPVDEIDPELVDAIDALGQAYCSDFTLGGLVRQIDVQGAHGPPIGFKSGYLDVQEGTCRVVTLRLPVIVNDVWTYG